MLFSNERRRTREKKGKTFSIIKFVRVPSKMLYLANKLKIFVVVARAFFFFSGVYSSRIAYITIRMLDDISMCLFISFKQ